MAAFCSQCGIALASGARFCHACGAAIDPSVFDPRAAQPQYNWGNPTRPLMRARYGHQLAGVCQGLANSYGWDVAVVRIAAILLGILVFPLGEIAYLAAWIGIPEEPIVPPATPPVSV